MHQGARSSHSSKTQTASQRSVVQDAQRLRKALTKSFFSGADLVKFSEETNYFIENLDL
jgi:hypothetical protein